MGSACKVRDKRSFGQKEAQVVWKAEGIDVALIELPEEIEDVEAITLGTLPEAIAGEKLTFQMYAYPLWARSTSDHRSASGGRQIEGVIYLADYSPDGWLVLEAERLPPEATAAESEWTGASGATIICDGLVIAVQRQHQNPSRPASLEAVPLWTAYADGQWQRLLEKHGIRPEPEIARLSTAEKPLDISWHEVSGQLLEERRQLTTNLMTRRGDVAHEVDQVFVPLGLVERRKVHRRSEDVSPERGSELYQESIGREPGLSKESDSEQEEITQKFEHQEFLEQVLAQGQSPKSKGKRIAIIGEPGSGKTTLLQQIGCWVLDTFPASMVIWISLADLQGDTLETYLEARWLRRVIRQAGGAEASQADKLNFANQFKRGQVWLLLDGLDEMQGTANPLSEIQRHIREGGWLQQARILLTCRVNLWDGNRNALDSFDVYRTLEFSYPQQVEQFVARWFKPQGRADLGQALCAALKEPGKERIRDLVKNPLRLMLLCFDWGLKEGRLPETQAGLYQRFVERIYEWKSEEFPTTDEQRQALNRALAKLSLAAIDDQDEQGNARFRLRHRFVQKFLNETMILDLALQLGWLNQVGVDADDPTQAVYAFYHATFEEYFAALAIDNSDFFMPRKHRHKPLPGKRYRIFESQWQQVFLLWLGHQDRKLSYEKETLIKMLMTFKDGCGGFYSDYAFLLAAVGIAEFKDCAHTDEIISQLIHWLFSDSYSVEIKQFSYFWIETIERLLGGLGLILVLLRLIYMLGFIFASFFISNSEEFDDGDFQIQIMGRKFTANSFTNWVRKSERTLFRRDLYDARNTARANWTESILSYTDTQRIVQALEKILESNQNTYSICEVAEVLSIIGIRSETIIRILEKTLRILEKTSDSTQNESIQIESIRVRVATNLSKIDPSNEIANRTLIYILESTKNEYARKHIVENLTEVASHSETTMLGLIQVIESKQQSKEVYDSVVKGLITIIEHNETAVQTLKKVLKSIQDDETRILMAGILGRATSGDETAIQTLAQVFKSTQNDEICASAAYVLGIIDPGNKMAIQELVQIMKSSKDENTCTSIAKYLSEISPGNEAVIKTLLQVLEFTQNDYVRTEAAHILGIIDPGNKSAIHELMQIIGSVKDEKICLAAAVYLSEIAPPGDKIVIRALMQLLESTQNEDARQVLVNCLGIAGRSGDEIAVQTLIQVAESTQDEYTCWTAANALIRISPGSRSVVIRALERILESTEDTKAYWHAAYSLADIDPGNEIAIQSCVRMIEAGQGLVPIYMHSFASENEVVIQALSRTLQSSQDYSIVISIANKLSEIDPENEDVTRALMQILKREQFPEYEFSKYNYNNDISKLVFHKITSSNKATREAFMRLLHQHLYTEGVQDLLMKCAKTLPYPDFYLAFHSSQ
jgi:HEAT repeat protein/energy-coupling factor transporter ATP-binding protein EcfA2